MQFLPFVSGNKGDSFVLAGWAKGDSAPLSDNRKFGIRVRFDGIGSTDEKYYLEFNPDADNWQYAAKAIENFSSR